MKLQYRSKTKDSLVAFSTPMDTIVPIGMVGDNASSDSRKSTCFIDSFDSIQFDLIR